MIKSKQSRNSVSSGLNQDSQNTNNDNIKRQTNYFVYHNTFAAPNVKVDFIGNNGNSDGTAMGLASTTSATQLFQLQSTTAPPLQSAAGGESKMIRGTSASLKQLAVK